MQRNLHANALLLLGSSHEASRRWRLERAVEAHVDNERTMLSVLPADVLRDLDAQLSYLLRALEPSSHGADAAPAS